MESLKELEALGLGLGIGLPSPAYLIGASLFGLIGFAAFRRGRSTGPASLTWVGVALMVYPYAVGQTWLLWTIGAGLSAWVYANWN